MRERKTKVTKEELVELNNLVERAKNAPVMAMSTAHALRGGMAADARSMVYDYAVGLVKKYGFNSKKYGVNTLTGEIVKMEE